MVSSYHPLCLLFNLRKYEFDSHDEPCWFNHEKEKVEKNIMLELITHIKERLNEINDGSYTVEDLETERLENL